MRRLLAGAAVLLLAPSLGAQDLSAVATGLEGWSLVAHVAGTWDSNVRFSSSGEADAAARPGARLTRTWVRSRGRLVLGGDAEGALFRRTSDLDRIAYAAEADGTAALTPRLSLRLAETFRVSRAQENPALASSGLFLGTLVARSTDGRAGLRYDLGPRTSALLDVTHQRVTFEEAVLPASWLAGAGLGVSWRRSAADTLTVSYEQQRASTDTAAGRAAQTTDLFGLVGSWRRTVRRAAVVATAGGRRFRPLEGGDVHTALVGGVRLEVPAGRGTGSLEYARSVTQAFGLGRLRTADQLSTRLLLPLGSRAALALSGQDVVSRDPADAGFRLRTEAVVTDLRLTVGRDLAVVGGYAFRRQEQDPLPPVTSHSVVLGLQMGQRWR